LRKDKQKIIAEFNSCNFHDDTVHGVRVLPSTSRRKGSQIQVDLTEYITNKPRLLTLTGCANFSFIADFDVLTRNAFANTEQVEANGDEELIRRILAGQMAHLNIEYWDNEGNLSDKHPTRRKLADVTGYILFRVLFYGGTLEVVARGFRITRPTAKTEGISPVNAGDRPVIAHN
jgi:hypothetical protein